MGRARRPTNCARLKRPYRVHVLCRIQERGYYTDFDVRRGKKMYTLLCILQLTSVFFSVCICFAAILVFTQGTNFVSYCALILFYDC